MFDMEMYWDDSGTHDGSLVAIAACYVADSEQWTHFVRNWDEARKEEGFDYFHMADFMATPDKQKKPFCDWDQKKRNHVYSRLVSIINTRVRIGFGFGIPVAAFEKYAPEDFKKEMCSDAFSYAVQCVTGLITQWYRKFGKGKPIQYVFEDRKGMGKVRQVFDMLKEKPAEAEKIGFRNLSDGLSFQNSRFSKPLQAADILAWNMYAHMRDIVLLGLPDTPRPYFEKLRLNRPMNLGFLSEEQIQDNFDDMRKYQEERGGKRAYLLPRAMQKLYGAECGEPVSEEEKIRAFIEKHGHPPPERPFIRIVR
jgi:hypothetical protein